MKIKYIVSVGSLVAMLSGPVMAGFVNDGFTVGNGTALDGRDQWKATHTTSVMVSNKVDRNDQPGTAAAIPILQTLSNVAALGASGTNVWTDFWTIPRPFVSDAAPAVDTSSTAMFFVTNQYWAVVYGAGGAVTSVCPSDIWGVGHAVTNDGTRWHRISVLHNYTAGKWSLFVDGAPLKTNMAFISNVSSYQWFSVQNGGGAASNVTWIDEVLITNRVPPGLTASGDGDSMSDAWELMYFGNFSAPSNTVQPNGFNNEQLAALGANPFVVSASEPGGSNALEYVFGAATPGIVSMDVTNPALSALKLNFSVGSNRTCTVLGSTNPNGPFTTVVGSFETGPAGSVTNWFVDTNGVNRGMQYFYRVAASGGDLNFSATNAETYVYYKQARSLQARPYGSNFMVGIMVDYGASNTLGSTLGQQLARGLRGGGLEVGDTLTVYDPDQTSFRLSEQGAWVKLPNDGTATTNTPILIGQAVLIQAKGLGTLIGTNSAVFAGLMQTNATVNVPVHAGWNMISWPYPTGTGSNNSWNATLTNGLANNADINSTDRIWVYRDGDYRVLQRRENGVWQFYPKTTSVPSNTVWGYLQFGEGVFYKNAGASATTWRP